VSLVSVEDALAQLKDVSTQVEHAVVFTADGKVVASTLPDGAGVAETATKLLSEAESLRFDEASSVTQLQAALPDGSVFVVRDGERAIAATTGPDPVIGLVMYDLRRALR
jgi:predicted regulator of Ras-like GTPase activity (Roadblock/LC7/MglB family)